MKGSILAVLCGTLLVLGQAAQAAADEAVTASIAEISVDEVEADGWQ